MITGNHLYAQQQHTQQQNNTERRNDAPDSKEYVRQVKDAWSTLEVFKHWHKDTEGIQGNREEKHVRGNGGLKVNDWRWFCHADSVGGDQIDAWHYCKTGKVFDRTNRKAFWDTVNEMADAAGIARPVRTEPTTTKKETYTNGHSSHTARRTVDAATGEIVEDEPAKAPQAKKDFSALNYRAEDGGILDAWLDLHGDDWLFVVGPDKWHYWNKTH